MVFVNQPQIKVRPNEKVRYATRKHGKPSQKSSSRTFGRIVTFDRRVRGNGGLARSSVEEVQRQHHQRELR
jgi:hypothetical protein